MCEKSTAKLRNQSGETIGETLVALLISALALMMLAGAVSSAVNMVNRSKAKTTEYYTEDAKLMSAVTATSSTAVTLTDSVNSISQTITANYAENTALGGVDVIAYAVPTPTPTPAPVP